MIKDGEYLRKFNREFWEKELMSLEEKYILMDSMHNWAVETGAISEENVMDGIETDIEMARVINLV
jgi:hypothetical protein